MKKAICMLALAAFSFGSVYAADINVGTNTVQQDTTKKKIKMKNGKKKMKMKNDSTKTKMKMKKDTMSKM